MNRFAIALPTAPPPASQLLPLAEGDVGTADTIRQMCRLIDEGARDPEVNRTALAIVHAYKVPQFDFEGERRAIFDWKRRCIRFFRDIEGKETLRSARETLAVRGGDCDCQTILTLALLKTIGQLVRIVTISTHPEAPDIFSHVFPEVRDERGRWLSVDTARKQPGYGKGPNHWYRRRIWDTDDGTFQDADAPSAATAIANRPVFAGMGCPQRPAMGLGYYGGNPRNHMGAQFVTVRQAAAEARRAGQIAKRLGRLRGLGQTDATLQDIVTALPSIEVGTSDIIAASRANPINLTATTNPASTVAAANSTTALGSSSSMLPLLLLGGGVVLVLVMAKR